ncbi:hypothetical protein L7F22_007504 [Adiantum nelumboides]|nr:hypothetical protein [Adiantum nelumboides]
MGIIFTEPNKVDPPDIPRVEESKLAKMLANDLTEKEKQAYLTILEDFPRLFIKGYDQITGVTVVQHHIKLKEGSKPTMQQLQCLGVIQQDALLAEVRKLLNAGFIYPVEDSEWVFLVVVIPKKNGKGQVCVDYKLFNAATKRDHFPLPFQDEILNEVARYESSRALRIEKMHEGLSRLQSMGGQLDIDKCHIGEAPVTLLGHVVFARGIEADPNKIQDFTSLGSPTSAKELVTFIQKVSTKVNFDLGPSNKGESSDRTLEHQLLFLKFQFVNKLGAKIYKDGMERYCVEVENRRGDMRDLVLVIYNADRYFDDQGFMYIVVLNPSIVDKWGMTGTKEKVDVESEEAPPALDKPNLKLQRINDMTRVNTENIFLGLYKYDGGEHARYYQCEEPLLKERTDEKKLYVFTYGEDVKSELIMIDKYGQSYVNVGPKELAGYTYFGGPLSNYYFTPSRPERVVRQIESMGYPVIPNMRPVLSETRPMESLGRTAHLGSGTYSRDTHAREAMSHRERDTDTRSSVRIPVESHSRSTDRRGDMSDRTRMWVETRRMRPSQVAKCMLKKYGRSDDPYAHVSLFKQVLRAEQITDFHTQYEGFRLTLEGTALTWFQPLDLELFPNIDNVLRKFAKEFSKRGEVHQKLQAYGFLPTHQEERAPEKSLGDTSKRGLFTVREGEKPYQELCYLLLDDAHQSRRRGHAQNEESPLKEKERSKSPIESMEEDVAPQRHQAKRYPTPTKRKRSPRSPPHRKSKKEENNSKKKKERKRSP